MKKILFTLAATAVLVSCDLPAGGNKGVLKKTEDVVRYSDAHAEKGTFVAQPDSTATDSVQAVAAPVVTDSTAAPAAAK